MSKMTITQALGEIKRLGERITKANSQFIPTELFSTIVNGKLTNGRDKKMFEDKAKSIYDSPVGLIERLATLKAAVAASNATTTIKWQDKEYLVVELIQMRSAIVEHKKTLLKQLLRVREEMIRQEARSRTDYDIKLAQAWQALAGGSSTNTPSYTSFVSEYEKHNLVTIFDPIGIQDKIDKLSSEIDSIDEELDTLLTISNSTTEIDV